jgi:signal transduction histidine kinase|tara:strand:+ start:688 stop:1878 length:1191 start_codon:yes stop_codon:yes gene_type:complete
MENKIERLPLAVSQALASLDPMQSDRPQGFEFTEFSNDELVSIFSIARIQQLDESEMLISNQETTEDLYFILKGQLRIEIAVPNAEIKKFLLSPGTVVGEQSFLDGEPRSANVTAETPCLVASLNSDSFAGLTHKHPAIALRIVRQLSRILSQRLRRLDLFDATELAREAERKRLAEELHDETMANLTGITMELGLLKFHQELDNGVLEDIDSVITKLKDTNLRLRQIVKGIHPAELVNSGLITALRSHLEDLGNQSVVNPTELKINLRSEGFGDQRLPLNIETDVYRVVQQAISNAIQHACASTIQVSVAWSDIECRFTVEDNGRGIGDIDPRDIVKGGHFGLANMKDRIERNGGFLEIGNATTSGTKLTGTISVANRTDIPDQNGNYEVTIKNT